MEKNSFRAGFVAIVGVPNVGKSTLMNALVGQKLSIVTNKPQTTRHKIIGILSGPEYQIVFLDTPGLLQPKYQLHRTMMHAAQAAISDADLVLYMIDCTRDPEQAGVRPEMDILKTLKKPVYLLVNKTDAVKKQQVADMIAVHSASYKFKEVFPLSALRNEGTEGLIQQIVKELPEHEPYYPADAVTEHPERFFVGELIREKIFEVFREEIPYSTTVDIIEFKERPGKKDLIEAEIYVERDSQKGILIGKKGIALKQIGETARKAIEEFLQRPVFLNLHVRVKGNWREQDAMLKRLGYK